MNEAYLMLKGQIHDHSLELSVLLQGESTKTELLNRFINKPNCILLGSYSFWEGIDVRGPALSLVIIDRLPFASPDDPVLSARIEKINRSGGNAFMEYQLPESIITLKQGAGRLIRDENDRGVLMICDPRIIKKSYGRLILNSLPPMKRAGSLEEVETFLQK
jgi:ATP-dependent DNA helicase DinG